jgi:hypothetical protein
VGRKCQKIRNLSRQCCGEKALDYHVDLLGHLKLAEVPRSHGLAVQDLWIRTAGPASPTQRPRLRTFRKRAAARYKYRSPWPLAELLSKSTDRGRASRRGVASTGLMGTEATASVGPLGAKRCSPTNSSAWAFRRAAGRSEAPLPYITSHLYNPLIAHTRLCGRKPAADCFIIGNDLCYATTRPEWWVVYRSKGDDRHGKQVQIGGPVTQRLPDRPRELP